jgi:hypothetical protein
MIKAYWINKSKASEPYFDFDYRPHNHDTNSCPITFDQNQINLLSPKPESPGLGKWPIAIA